VAGRGVHALARVASEVKRLPNEWVIVGHGKAVQCKAQTCGKRPYWSCEGGAAPSALSVDDRAGTSTGTVSKQCMLRT
jgi:hypothetical protein